MGHFFNGKAAKKEQAAEQESVALMQNAKKEWAREQERLKEKERKRAGFLSNQEKQRLLDVGKKAAEQQQRDMQEKIRKEKQREDLLKESGARLATFKEYADWFEAHFKRDNEPIQYCFIEGKTLGAYIIRHPVHVPTVYGLDALRLIVPGGVAVTHGGLGSNELLMADGEYKSGAHHAVLYKDMKEELERRGYSFEPVGDDLHSLGAPHMRVAQFPPSLPVLDPEVRAAMRVLNNKPALRV